METNQLNVALINFEQMQVLAKQVDPNNYKKTLKTYNLTPQAMAACMRHFCGIVTVEEEKEIAYFQNKKDVHYKDYIATGARFLCMLKNENDRNVVTPFDWAASSIINIISKQADEQNKELVPQKDCLYEWNRWTCSVGLTTVIFGLGMGIGLIARATCY
jgi:hypothetical protein